MPVCAYHSRVCALHPGDMSLGASSAFVGRKRRHFERLHTSGPAASRVDALQGINMPSELRMIKPRQRIQRHSNRMSEALNPPGRCI
jgi:hypothetical protein